MIYEKPELKIEKFDMIDDVMAEGLSTSVFNPIDDEQNDNPGLPFIGEAIENILGI